MFLVFHTIVTDKCRETHDCIYNSLSTNIIVCIQTGSDVCRTIIGPPFVYKKKLLLKFFVYKFKSIKSFDTAFENVFILKKQ